MPSEPTEAGNTGRVWTTPLRQRLEALATEQGFALAGVALAAPVPATAAHLASWIDQGHAGEMEYLKRRDPDGTLLRSSVQVSIPWARSVIVCAFNYHADAARSLDPASHRTGWIARYAWNGREEAGKIVPTDYHDDLLARLRAIEFSLLAHTPCQTRCYVDTGPILERDFAARAGVGWIGKNTCVLNEQLGSWLLLGVIVTSLDLPVDRAPSLAPDRCGSCTRCIDACPTDALLNTGNAPRAMDASLCIAYLTIKKKGSIPEPLREPMGRQVFGCDICQEVCPWNHQAPIALADNLQTRTELVNPNLSWLASMDGTAFKLHFKGSPLERTGRKRLHRNIAIAMGNAGERTFLPQLELWASGDDLVLAETAQWAIRKISAAVQKAAAPVSVLSSQP